MDVAVRLDSESGRPRNDDHSNTNHHQLNVAHVCTGLAFELAYKSLLVAAFIPLEKTHNIKKLHTMLPTETQESVEQWFKDAGWEKRDKLLEYLDERMSHPDRKYWMENPWARAKTGIRAGPGFAMTGKMTIPDLTSILYKMANLGAENLTTARQQMILIGRIREAKACNPATDVHNLETQLSEQGYKYYRSLPEK